MRVPDGSGAIKVLGMYIHLYIEKTMKHGVKKEKWDPVTHYLILSSQSLSL